MKKSLLLFSILAMAITGFSQSSNLIVFSENGEHFSVILNGILQNAQPETNVMVTDLIAPSYKVKIMFENRNIPDLEKGIYFQDPNVQATYRLVLNKKGKYVLRFFNSVPLAQAPAPPPAQQIVEFSTTPAAPPTTVVQTTTTTTTGDSPIGENVNVNMGINGVNVNMNINTGNQAYSTQTTTTTTTTTTDAEVDTEYAETYVLPGYNGAYGCPWPMSDADFEDAKRSIASKDFSDSKLKMSKQIIDSNCLLSSQVMQLMQLFDFEDDKLELAKYAYGHTLDYGNYYKVNNAFEYESSIDELDEHIGSFRR